MLKIIIMISFFTAGWAVVIKDVRDIRKEKGDVDPITKGMAISGFLVMAAATIMMVVVILITTIYEWLL